MLLRFGKVSNIYFLVVVVVANVLRASSIYLALKTFQVCGSRSRDNRWVLQAVKEFGRDNNSVRGTGMLFPANYSENLLQNDAHRKGQRGTQVGFKTQSLSLALV